MSKFDPNIFLGKPMADVMRYGENAMESGRAALLEARATFKLCLAQDVDIYLKGKLNHQLWHVEKKLGEHPLYLSESGQDRFIYQTFFKDQDSGSFLEIGGFNGWQSSNCYFFEKTLGWSGIIVEASKKMVEEIQKVRSSKVLHAAMSDKNGKADFIEITSGFTQMSGLAQSYDKQNRKIVKKNKDHSERRIKVPTLTMQSLFNTHELEHVDYCSIDVEGAERTILEGVDFSRCSISVLSVENNTRDPEKSVRSILENAGYELVTMMGVDEIYARK